ncbi:MAG: hypothetical protein KGO96_07135 [Elusimicrobia bacterium]|nr:hypothetical protein [Elusimicrobiota bacterium]
MVNLWLDDIRPAPEGYIHVKTVEEAKEYFLKGPVDNMSFDNDLGIKDFKPCSSFCEDNRENTDCLNCIVIMNTEGYVLLDWIEANNLWPVNKPTVHSQNAVRTEYMRKVIDRHY